MFRISNKNKRTIVFITYTKQKEYHNQTKTVAWSLPNIGHRTQSDRAPNAIRSDTERNPIGRRTESARTPNANGERNYFFIRYLPITIGTYAAHKRMIGTNSRTMIIVNKASAIDEVLKKCLKISIKWKWNPNIKVVPIEMSVIAFQ